MLLIDDQIQPSDLSGSIDRLWEVSGPKIRSIQESSTQETGAPVFTVRGRYTSRGWTEWTQGFQFGSAILQFDATGEREFLETGRDNTVSRMGSHLTHFGVHDHGFNNVSTYGNLLRLIKESKIAENPWEKTFYELALKCSAAVQARRWTELPDGGYIHSFNGPHSLFADTLRSLRSLALGHLLQHSLMDEQDRRVSLLGRLVDHARTTARYAVYYGSGRDAFDVRGRVAHESIFNVRNGSYRCPNSQQGYSPFTTWTRGLAWIMCGFAEQLEFLESLRQEEPESQGGLAEVSTLMLEAARACCDFYIDNTPSDGIPYWDTGAPRLHRLGDYLDRPADPFNDFEPVDSSAAAIACQGLMRLGRHLGKTAAPEEGERYWQAGLTVLRTLLSTSYLCLDEDHQGLLRHSVYHVPNGWDYIPPGRSVPCGESSMWGDYHLREAALYVQRIARDDHYLTFFGPSQARKPR